MASLTEKNLIGFNIGFIGLGLMGKPMAQRLHDAGANIVINNRSQGVVDELVSLGLSNAASPADVARKCDIIIMALPDTDAVEKILFQPNGIADGVSAGKLIIDIGTTETTKTRVFGQRIQKLGATYMDAPVSGGTIGAETGTLVFMVGGSEKDFSRSLPILEVLGKSSVLIGSVGAGQVAKAANQIIVGINISAVAEALKLAQSAGVEPEKVRQALQGGFAGSRILDVHGKRMIDEIFTPGGKCITQRKDLFQALKLAKEYELRLPNTELVMEQYDLAITEGHGDLDHSALIKVLK